ncbi:MAG: transposase zinc-binding domain-containing protein [Polyangiaceae bacterium]|nr:transposase zinc-binding domain-containing protein [Polyangiaceae bacterium]
MLAPDRHAHHEGYRYERHRPEESVLYRVVREHWSSFREGVEGLGSLPKFVVNEVDEYLRCGLLEYGFIRAVCESCGCCRLVAFSCKHRGFCPSCLGRRMSDTAVWLTEHVLPTVQMRQWDVCPTLPWPARCVRRFLGLQRQQLVAEFCQVGDFSRVTLPGHLFVRTFIDIVLDFRKEWFDHSEARVWLLIEQAAFGINPRHGAPMLEVPEPPSNQFIPCGVAYLQWRVTLLGFLENGGREVAAHIRYEEFVAAFEAFQEARFRPSVFGNQFIKTPVGRRGSKGLRRAEELADDLVFLSLLSA